MALHWTPSSNSIPLLYWGPQNWTHLSKCGLTSAEQRRRMASLDLLAILCLMHPRIPLACLASSAHCWLTFNLASTGTLRAFSAKLLPSWVAPSTHWFPQVQGFTLLTVEVHDISVNPLLQVMRIAPGSSRTLFAVICKMKYEKYKNRVKKETFQALQKL